MRALRELDARIKLFISLPIEKLDKMALQEKLREIGRRSKETAQLTRSSSARSSPGSLPAWMRGR